MALLTRSANAGFDGIMAQTALRIPGTAGSALKKWDACYIDGGGNVYPASTGCAVAVFSGSAATIQNSCYVGFAEFAANSGEPVTLVRFVAGTYGSSLTPGALYYVSATSGSLSTSAVLAGDRAVASAVDTTRVLAL